jgi:hypothetical protein
MTLRDIERAVAHNNEHLADAKRIYEEQKAKLEAEQEALLRQKSLLLKNVDIDKVLEAERILEVRYKDTSDFDEWPVKQFMEALDSESFLHSRLYREYPYVKNYGGFYHQEGWCEYGYHPSHGYVVCRVELRHHKMGVIANEDVEACLYYLNWMLDPEVRELLHK